MSESYQLLRSFKGVVTLFDAQVQKMYHAKQEMIKRGLHVFFRDRYDLNSFAAIQERTKTHDCRWMCSREFLHRPAIDRFVVDGFYVAEFRIERESTEWTLSWKEYETPIPVKGHEKWT